MRALWYVLLDWWHAMGEAFDEVAVPCLIVSFSFILVLLVVLSIREALGS